MSKTATPHLPFLADPSSAPRLPKTESSQIYDSSRQRPRQSDSVRLGIAKEPANSGLIGLGALSPRTHFLVLGGQITESLRPTPLIFPFSGDDGRRLGSCWRSRASRYMIGRRTARFTPAAPPSATHPRTSRG